MDNRFTEYSDNELMTAYQRECENNGWGSSRARYLAELQTELERRFDCSEIIDGNAMSLATKNVVLCDGKIHTNVTYDPPPPPDHEGNWF